MEQVREEALQSMYSLVIMLANKGYPLDAVAIRQAMSGVRAAVIKCEAAIAKATTTQDCDKAIEDFNVALKPAMDLNGPVPLKIIPWIG